MAGPIRFSAGRDTYDNRPAQLIVEDFGAFVEHIEAHRGTEKGLDYVCGPMSFGPHDDTKRYPCEANYRLASHAEPCAFLSLDIDYIADAQVQQMVLARAECLSSYAYETASSTPSTPRMRVIFALDRELGRAERIKLGCAVETDLKASIEAEFGQGTIKFDPSVYRPEQPNYNPTIGSKSWRFL